MSSKVKNVVFEMQLYRLHGDGHHYKLRLYSQ